MGEPAGLEALIAAIARRTVDDTRGRRFIVTNGSG